MTHIQVAGSAAHAIDQIRIRFAKRLSTLRLRIIWLFGIQAWWRSRSRLLAPKLSIYTVQAINVVDGRHTHISLSRNSKYLVLLTCYPFDAIIPGGPLRYAATAIAESR